MTVTLSIETPAGDFISVKLNSNHAANEIERLLDIHSDCKVRRPVQFREREEINDAIKRYHIERGCCDGTFKEPCLYKAQLAAKENSKSQSELHKREKEQEKLDAIAFQNAELQ